MIMRQMFDNETCTFTYVIASGYGREAIIIDPVNKLFDQYLRLIHDLDCKIVMALDTHTHADHISGRCQFHHRTDCAAVMGEHTKAVCVTVYAKEGESLNFDGINIKFIYTPGHTDDSYSFLIGNAVYTGDALLILGTGRTDFQNGNAGALYDSITQKLFKLPETTIVYPAHDYNGKMSSSIYDEIRTNPRLAGKSKEEFIQIMKKLHLSNPQMLDATVAANLSCRESIYAT